MEWGGVGLLPFLRCKKKWGSRIEGGVLNTRVSHSSLNSGEFTFYSYEDLGMFKLRAKNNIHHQKGPELAKKKKQQKRPLPVLSYLCLSIVPAVQTTRKPATRKETPHN